MSPKAKPYKPVTRWYFIVNGHEFFIRNYDDRICYIEDKNNEGEYEDMHIGLTLYKPSLSSFWEFEGKHEEEILDEYHHKGMAKAILDFVNKHGMPGE